MLYKPSFCCHCGEKIERTDWGILTSRRFCNVCKEENKGHEVLRLGVAFAALLLPLSVISGHFSSGEKEIPSPQKSSLTQPVKKSASADIMQQVPATSLERQTTAVKDSGRQIPMQEPLAGEIGKQPAGQKTTSDEPIFYCGAVTKKGTACTRKVKVKGRCWQHAGRGISVSKKSQLGN